MNDNCGINGSVTKYYVIEPSGNAFTGSTINGNLTVSGDIFNCDSGSTIFVSTLLGCTDNIINLGSNLLPITDDTITLGSPVRRFRDINTFSGNSTVWTSSNQIITPNLNLGLDSQNNLRVITADNSIISNDFLHGGYY